MKQYLELARAVKEKGTYKGPAREGMPGTTSLFGYQFRHDLSEGFPILTTKKLSFKNIVVELLWFLRGDTNIKFLVDNGCNIWNEDAYNYYVKVFKTMSDDLKFGYGDNFKPLSFDKFIEKVKDCNISEFNTYNWGDCGKQYGWLWRRWSAMVEKDLGVCLPNGEWMYSKGLVPVRFDQIQELLKGLKESPTGRRHILTAWNPTTLDDMALNACHALVQFNCRPLSLEEREKLIPIGTPEHLAGDEFLNTPQYYLDCQMYQRSADLFLGVPYNIASYALLTHIFAIMNNMIPGDFVHTFGDVHIYDNHMDQINEQLTREPKELPKLDLSQWLINSMKEQHYLLDFDEWIESVGYSDFGLNGYDPHPAIKGELSTGLKK